MISGTTASEFSAYLERLESYDYHTETLTEIDGNLYACMSNMLRRVYVYYTASEQTVRVIDDGLSVSAKRFSYTTPVGEYQNDGAMFWLYGLNMAEYPKPDNSPYPNCGQLQIIRCADNSVILIDGGTAVQSDAAQLDAFLHQITGKTSDETVTVSCWYITHVHSDHMGGVYQLLNQYSSKYDLQRLLVNTPMVSQYKDAATDMAKSIASMLNAKYPACMELKAHAGQVIQLSDVTLQVLFTHEDLCNMNGTLSMTEKGITDEGEWETWTYSDFNNTGTVAKLSANGMSMMVLGDANTSVERVMVTSFSAHTLKCDMVQVAHHGINRLTDIYRLVNAPIALIPQTEQDMTNNPRRTKILAEIQKYSTDLYYSGEYGLTVGFYMTSTGIAVQHVAD